MSQSKLQPHNSNCAHISPSYILDQTTAVLNLTRNLMLLLQVCTDQQWFTVASYQIDMTVVSPKNQK